MIAFCVHKFQKMTAASSRPNCYYKVPGILPKNYGPLLHTKLTPNEQAIAKFCKFSICRSVFSDGAWSGYIFNETLNTWGFIDGSSVPDGSWISGDLNNRDNGNPAHCARFYGNNLNDRGCGSRFPYVCSHPGNTI